MSTNTQRHDLTPPPPLDEGYWSALLHEGEYAEPAHDHESPNGRPPAHSDYTAEESLAPTAYHQDAEDDWTEIRRIMDHDEVIELAVFGYNRGGLLVEWRSLRGFVPASQLNNFPATANGTVRRNALMGRVGQTLMLRVIELSREQNRLILSERAARVQPGERANILAHLNSDDTVTGVITNLCDFGAFVDLGGVEGLIHISELSWGRVGHPADMLQRGQTVDAYVLDVNRAAGRIALSLKRLHPDPWETVESRYTIDQRVEGVITNVVDFGAFVCIEDGLEGLIHVSELAEGHFLHPRNVVSEGQSVRARILTIDSHARRLGLSLRSVGP